MSYRLSVDESREIRRTASNVRPGSGQLMTYARFIELYPQFGESSGGGDEPIEQNLVEIYLEIASKAISSQRWRAYWEHATGLFVAHFSTLYLMTYVDPGSPASDVVASAEARGIISSESASDVSASYDVNSITGDLEGWAAWKLTMFGQQLATLGKMAGMGGMMV